jgi:hypothetical protein
VTELTQLFDLPNISVDLQLDRDRTIDYHAERIKGYVKEDFNFFSLLGEVLPPEMRFDGKQIGKILADPLGFIGAIISDGITRYTRGEIELKNQFTVFSESEPDLLKCLGLIIIHFVNERSNNLVKNLIKNPVTKISSTFTAYGMKTSYQYLYPYDYKMRFQKLFMKLFGRVLPSESLSILEEMDANMFTDAVLDGCELALYDLGLPKLRNLESKTVIPLALSLSDILLTGPSKLIQGVWHRVAKITHDILENDFRRYAEE